MYRLEVAGAVETGEVSEIAEFEGFEVAQTCLESKACPYDDDEMSKARALLQREHLSEMKLDYIYLK